MAVEDPKQLSDQDIREFLADAVPDGVVARSLYGSRDSGMVNKPQIKTATLDKRLDNELETL